MLVEDAHGQPPSVPFWTGEAPQRTLELSSFVSALREEISARTPDVCPGYISQANLQVAETVAWLREQCCVNDAAAEQMIGYIVAGRAVLGVVPTLTTIVAERFFDEGGGMQLILHAPFGGRINKAWGLALRKRFCRGFNFELQAAATDNGLNISLAEQHSFALSDVFQFLTQQTVGELIQQASLTSPIFKARWRWDACRSLQLLRFQKGKKVPPQIMRTRGDDLLANVFPQVAACQENIEGDIEIPDHPLVREVMKDVLQEAMDLEGLTRVLGEMHAGRIRCVAVDTTTPSQFSHELLNANPYAFLDDAPQEERRARAVAMRGTVPDSVLGESGRLSAEAIAEVREGQWPDLRDEHELHDMLTSLICVPVTITDAPGTRDWPLFLERLVAAQRASIATIHLTGEVRSYWVVAERLAWLRTLWPDLSLSFPLPTIDLPELSAEEVTRRAVQGWMSLLGPATARSLGARLGLVPGEVWKQLLHLEVAGTLMRGAFESDGPAIEEHDIEWCERRLLQRIHKRTLGALRRQVEPVTPGIYLRWLLGWQHVAPQTQLTGEQGLLEALRGLEGFEAPAIEWERSLLSARVAAYDPRWLDSLCLAGVIGWGRVSPHPAFYSAESGGPRRVVPTSMAPITFFLREEALWMDMRLQERQIPEASLACCLSDLALKLRSCLHQHGAIFSADFTRICGVPATEVSRALWELVAAGMVTADGFESLRILIDPRRKQVVSAPQGARRVGQSRNTAGRWGLLAAANAYHSADAVQESVGEAAERREAELASACAVLLRRYGMVFRDVLERESTMPRWRELLPVLRRMEARGEVRGGRFLSGFSGEQFALPDALASLREARRSMKPVALPTEISAADPLNLVGILTPGDRVAATAGKSIIINAATFTLEESSHAAAPLSQNTIFPDQSWQGSKVAYE